MTVVRVTWPKLVEREPRLAELEQRVAQLGELPESIPFCGDRAWFGGLCERLYPLVGCLVRDPMLGSADAYDTAYAHLRDLLPPCRGRCGCPPQREIVP
jgi:hypothetical protein